jgi:hypothetical protein
MIMLSFRLFCCALEYSVVMDANYHLEYSVVFWNSLWQIYFAVWNCNALFAISGLCYDSDGGSIRLSRWYYRTLMVVLSDSGGVIVGLSQWYCQSNSQTLTVVLSDSHGGIVRL